MKKKIYPPLGSLALTLGAAGFFGKIPTLDEPSFPESLDKVMTKSPKEANELLKKKKCEKK